MAYTTRDEFDNFDFTDAHICEVAIFNGNFNICLDAVKILENNSQNRDIRVMRTNGLILKLTDCAVKDFVREGYRKYDMGGNVIEEVSDEAISETDYKAAFDNMADGLIYQLTRDDKVYTLEIDGADERTYSLRVEASGDQEDWERFMNL